MSEKRVQVAYHFKIDPAQMIPGAVRIPETITRTIAVGDELKTEKVSSSCLSPSDRAALTAEINSQTVEANRVAQPADSAPALEQPTGPAALAETGEELEAF